MKILPITYNILKIQHQALSTQPLHSAILFKGEDCFEISPKEKSSYLAQAKNISGIHCPVCGSAMLTQEEYAELLNKASQVKNTQGFLNLLSEYEDYIPVKMFDILNGMFDNQNLENMDFKKYVKTLKNTAWEQHRATLKSANNYLKTFSGSLDDESSIMKILNAVETVRENDSYFDYRKKIVPILKEVTLSNSEYFDVYNKTALPLKNSSMLCSIFNISDINDKNNSDIALELARKIFSKSIMHTSQINKQKYLDNPNNEILLCSDCDKNSSTHYFVNRFCVDKTQLKENTQRYLNDLSIKVGAVSREGNTSYIRYLSNSLEWFSRQDVHFSDIETNKLIALNKLGARHENFTPIVQTEVDIPCAGCGSTMLPHEIKSQIVLELNECKNPRDYANVLRKYDKYIGVYAKDTVKTIFKIIDEDKDISNEAFVVKLQNRINRRTEKEIRGVLADFLDIRSFVVKKSTFSELEKYDLIIKRLYDYVSQGKLKDSKYNYKELFLNSLKDVDINTSTPAIVYKLLNKIKIACFKNSYVQINAQDKLQDENELYTIMFKLFNSDTATADHLIPVTKGGEGSIDNLIGLCRCCNQVVKGNKKVFSWYIQNEDVKNNLPKQLYAIDKMSKEGKLEGYENWAKNISQKLYDLTYKDFDIRKDFE